MEEPEMMVLIKKIQQHLVFLERKIDTLIGQSSDRSFNKGKRFSKPYRPGGPGGGPSSGPGGHSSHQPRRDYGNRSGGGERSFSK